MLVIDCTGKRRRLTLVGDFNYLFNIFVSDAATHSQQKKMRPSTLNATTRMATDTIMLVSFYHYLISAATMYLTLEKLKLLSRDRSTVSQGW